MNRPVRTRMQGGVGGEVGNGLAYPISPACRWALHEVNQNSYQEQQEFPWRRKEGFVRSFGWSGGGYKAPARTCQRCLTRSQYRWPDCHDE